MRELKFRAFDGKEMRYDVTGFEHGKDNEMAGVFIDGDLFAIKGSSYEGRHPVANVMQYTGLKDCNGVEIYEGDICKLIFHADKSFESIAEVRNRQHQIVFWNDNEFKQAYKPTGGYWSKSAKCLSWYGCAFQCIDIHVIGNIHSNPELLENNQ